MDMNDEFREISRQNEKNDFFDGTIMLALNLYTCMWCRRAEQKISRTIKHNKSICMRNPLTVLKRHAIMQKVLSKTKDNDIPENNILLGEGLQLQSIQ